MVQAPDVFDGRAGGGVLPDIRPRRYHRPAGDFRTSEDNASNQPHPGDPYVETNSVRTRTVRWPKFECATARGPPPPREPAPWAKGDQPSTGWKTSRFADPSSGAAGVCTGVELSDSAVSGEAPDWMQIWEVPKSKQLQDSWERDPLQQCSQRQFRPKVEGAAGMSTGVALDDSAISGDAPSWMLVNKHIPTSTASVEDQNSVGWKTDGFLADPSNGAAGVCSGVTHGDSAISGQAPGWMHIEAVDNLYGISEKEQSGVWGPPPEVWQPVLAVDQEGAAGVKSGGCCDDSAESGNGPTWMEIKGIPRTDPLVPREPKRNFPHKRSIRPWLQGRQPRERRYSLDNRGAAGRHVLQSLSQSKHPTGSLSDKVAAKVAKKQQGMKQEDDDLCSAEVKELGDSQLPSQRHPDSEMNRCKAERLPTPYNNPMGGGVPPWAAAMKQSRQLNTERGRALPSNAHSSHAQRAIAPARTGLDRNPPSHSFFTHRIIRSN